MDKLDLTKRRSPSEWRNLLEVRVRRLAASKPEEVRRQATEEIHAISKAMLEQQ